MKEMLLDSARRSWKSPLLLGQLFIWSLILLGSFMIALLIRYTSMGMDALPIIAYMINALALLIGGFVSGRRSKQRGWYYGGLQGIIYALLVMLIGFLAFDTAMVINPILFAISSFGISAIGGILGVNTGNQ
ncbi:TIGR04086 family membrane protein [Hazenella coriacea]|uniref:Putative membrane protein (TIGR04086 family) n=1 Tax=Hazenella coriacea TaxID=1179467 RepID=A0A4R3LB84_9BACL|nr:TIGR04086 family membrane protein [Hazenella coriacea]TCS96460.1 putative membrane protein (TIGR04086 family) [Hazenella coriacea]